MQDALSVCSDRRTDAALKGKHQEPLSSCGSPKGETRSRAAATSRAGAIFLKGGDLLAVKERKPVDSVPALEAELKRIRAAQKEYSVFTQEQVDKIFLAAASAANRARVPLAKMAVEETGMGVVEDKVVHIAVGHLNGECKAFDPYAGIPFDRIFLRYVVGDCLHFFCKSNQKFSKNISLGFNGVK